MRVHKPSRPARRRLVVCAAFAACAAGAFLATAPRPAPLAAQDAQSADACRAALVSLWTRATDACINKPVGYVCNGGDALAVEPQGPVSSALAVTGALVETAAIDALRTPRLTPETGGGGVAFLRQPAPLLYTLLLIGDVTVRDISPPEFPAWTSFAMATDIATPPPCAAAPLNAAILQTPVGLNTRVVVNGVSIGLAGTLVVRTDYEVTTFTMLSGVASILSLGVSQTLPTGNSLTVAHSPQDYAITTGPPSAPVPFNPDLLVNLPLELLDRPVILPQPGSVTTQGAVNMRSAPSVNAGVIIQVPTGEVLSVLGRSEDGAWFHVRRDNGETGWMLGELLARNLGEIRAVYRATPLPPQRLGEFATRGRVSAPAGVNLRTGPDGTFPAMASLSDGTIVNLISRSPYSPWVRVENSGVQGWVALVALETTTYFEALPIDPSAPPPPEPTRVPGSFGNAFPDPNEPSITPP
jgi:uncharacterized protein YraI